jgi:hypothetical protein
MCAQPENMESGFLGRVSVYIQTTIASAIPTAKAPECLLSSDIVGFQF